MYDKLSNYANLYSKKNICFHKKTLKKARKAFRPLRGSRNGKITVPLWDPPRFVRNVAKRGGRPHPKAHPIGVNFHCACMRL